MIELHPPIRVPRRNIPCTNPSFRKGPFEAFRECGAVVLEGDPSDPLDLTGKWGENYTHWIVDVFSAYHFWENQGRTPGVKLREGAQHVEHIAHSLSMRGLISSKSDFSCNVINPLAYSSLVHPETVRWWREEAGFIDIETPRYVLIQRAAEGSGPTQSRNFTERAAIHREFEKRGIWLSTVYLEGTSLDFQANLFKNADLIIAAHGSALTNLMFCKPTCKVIEVASVSRHNQTYSDIASYLDFPMIVAEGVEKKLHGPDKDYCLDIDPSYLLELYHSL